MELLRNLVRLIEAMFLMETFIGREVTSRDGEYLGSVSDIKIDDQFYNMLMVVEHQGHWQNIPVQQILNINNKIIYEESRSADFPLEESHGLSLT